MVAALCLAAAGAAACRYGAARSHPHLLALAVLAVGLPLALLGPGLQVLWLRRGLRGSRLRLRQRSGSGRARLSLCRRQAGAGAARWLLGAPGGPRCCCGWPGRCPRSPRAAPGPAAALARKRPEHSARSHRLWAACRLHSCPRGSWRAMSRPLVRRQSQYAVAGSPPPPGLPLLALQAARSVTGLGSATTQCAASAMNARAAAGAATTVARGQACRGVSRRVGHAGGVTPLPCCCPLHLTSGAVGRSS